MKSIQAIMQNDHEHLDTLLLSVETAVKNQDWQGAERLFAQFRDRTVSTHMKTEEELLFPAFERWSQEADHPLTSLLRKGHQDLRVFFAEIEESLQQHDAEEFSDLLSTVKIILQQHDAKEENELYPHLDAALPGQMDIIRQRMDTVGE